MTIELLDLDVLPSGLASQAYTMVGVASPSGPMRYKAPIGPATPGALPDDLPRITTLPSDADVVVRLADGSLAVIEQSLALGSTGSGTSGGGSVSVPANTVAPSVSGSAQQGQTLTAAAGTWSGSPTFAYQWLRAGSPISGATASTYLLVSDDVGSAIAVQVVATNGAGSATAVSSATAAVLAVSSGGSGATSAAAVQSSANIPTSGTAFDPLAQGTLIYSGIPTAYVCLYHGGSDEGARRAFGGGELPALTPQDTAGGSYTIRAYDASSAGNCFYESPVITIAANPNKVGGSLTLTPTSTGAWKTSVVTGGNLLNNDTYIAANGPMTDASVYASTSSTIPPDQPGGSASVIGTSAHVVDANNTRLYVNNLYVNGTGQVYVWVIAVSAIDGTTTRSILGSISPITVSASGGSSGGSTGSSGSTGGGTTTPPATSSYPTFAMTGDTYETKAPISGSGSLKTGTGNVSLTLPANTNAVTVEGFFNLASNFSQNDPAFALSANGGGISLGWGGDKNSRLTEGSNTSYGSALSAGLHHVAVVWGASNGNAYTFYLDGVAILTKGSATQSTLPAAGQFGLNIALPSDGSTLLDSLRVSDTARYTAAFTPPAAPLAADANTIGLWQFDGNANGA